MKKPSPPPVRAPAAANCGRHISSSVSRFTICVPLAVRPPLNSTLMNRLRSSTVEYMLPAGTIPSGNVGGSEAAAIDGPHHRVSQLRFQRRQRLERAVLQTHGLEYRPLQVVRERFVLRALQHVADDGDRRVRVLELLLGSVNERPRVETAHGRGQRRRGGVEVVADGRLAHQPCAVRHQLPERDRFSGCVGRCEIRDVARHRRVEVERAALHQLHDAEVGEELGHGADAVHGFRARACAVAQVLKAEPARPDNALVIDQRNRDCRDVVIAELPLDERLELLRDARVLCGRGNSGLCTKQRGEG